MSKSFCLNPSSFVKLVGDLTRYHLTELKEGFYGYVLLSDKSDAQTKYLVQTYSPSGEPMYQSYFYCENLERVEISDIFKKLAKHGGYQRKSLKQKNRKLSRRLYGGRPVTDSQRKQLLAFGYNDAEIKEFSPDVAILLLKLRDLGHDKNQISKMTCAHVNSILKLAGVPERWDVEDARLFLNTKFTHKEHYNPNDARPFFNRPHFRDSPGGVTEYQKWLKENGEL